MVDENKRCTCTTPEITIKLNKQGPQGLVGPQGNPGFSPIITVEEDTSTNYKLNIQTEQGSFITPNLKGSIPAGGSAGSVLTRTESGGAEFAPIPYATTSTSGIVVFATQEDVDDGETGLAITSDIIRNYYTKTQTDGKYVDLTSQQDVTGRKIFSDLRTNSIAEPNGNTYISYYRDGVDSNLNSVTLGGINTPNVYINRGGLIGTNIDSNNIGSYALTSLPIASTSTLGGVKVDGTTITIDANGVISGASTYVLPTASTNTLGGVKIDGTTITIDNDGVISSQAGGSSYTAGNGIDITNDEISIDTSVVATQSDIPTNYVTTDTTQSITETKNFTGYSLTPANIDFNAFSGGTNGTIRFGGYTSISADRISIDGTSYRRLILGDYTNFPYLELRARDNIRVNRGGYIYTNIDSGNLSANLPTATDSSLGVIKPDGTTVTIDANGTLSALATGPSYSAGTGIDITNDTISAKLGVGGGLAISSVSNGLYVDTDETTIQINPSGKLSVGPGIVTTNTSQEITGSKTFKQGITLKVGNLTSAENIFLLSSYMCSRINTSRGWENTTALGRMIVYRHPLQSEQGILEIGSTGATTYNDTPYYYAGKLRLVAPEILTRYDGTNEYEVLDENNIATNATITGLTSRISTLEDTITNLTNRITALETAINGGNA